METKISFFLDQKNNKQILITIPDIFSKVNLFYEPTERLHQFDEATVYFQNKINQLEINKDVLDHILFTLNGALQRAISNQLLLPNSIKIGQVGYAMNVIFNSPDIFNEELKKYIIWCSLSNIFTLIYNANDKIYLEIAPFYPWTFSEPKDAEITFDEFMKSYKPYAVEEISHATALQWLETSTEYLKHIGFKPYIKKEQ